MVDRIDIGMDSDTDGTETPSFFQSQRTVSPTEYGSSFVNFYNTSLGLPTLEEETGIEVKTPEVELATPTVRDTTTGGDDFQPNILEQTAFGTDDPMNEVVFGLGTGDFNSYSDYLASGADGKFSDRVPLVQNIIEPLADGRYSDIKFGETASTEVEQKAKSVGKDIQETPGRLERLATGKLTTKDSNKLVKGALTVMGGLPGAIAGSFIGGRPVKNAFNKNSYRPNGAMGLVADVVHSIQYKDIANIRAAEQAAGGFYDTAQGKYITNNALDTGFAMRIGNRGITRSPGDGTYTGNMSGLSREHVKALEAVSKGFDPRGYNMSDPTKSRLRIEESGGSFVSGNPMEGFYRANGTFYSPSANISSAYGTVSNRNALAAKNGITPDQADNALSAARSGTKTLAQAIQDIRNASQPSAPSPKKSTETSAESGTYTDTGKPAAPVDYGALSPEDFTSYEQPESGADSGTQSIGGMPDYSSGPGQDFRSGGRVGYAPGGAVAQGGSGFVDRPPEQVSEAESVADNQPDAVPEGTFIINNPAVEFAGSDDIRKMLMDAHKEAIRRGITVDNDGKGAKLIDVALSRGEVKVAPHLAKIIGYDRLNKINNRGKPEVEERIEENGQAAPAGTMQAAMGMLISGQMKKPDLTQQDVQGFIPQPEFAPLPSPQGPPPPPRKKDEVFFNYRLEDIKKAVRNVEIKGFEDQPYIFTGVRPKKGKSSSAFGPMQITASSLEDVKERSKGYKKLDKDTKAYIDSLILQGDDKVNLDLYGGTYRDDKKRSVSKELKSKFGRYGMGVIPVEDHEKYYDVAADLVLRQKLLDHKTLPEALAAYGEGEGYAKKVLKGLP